MISISSTYNSRIMKFPSENLRKYTHWSATVLVYS
ncbi:hypothetical protein LOK49_LG09G01096 [Camellia lanceoleosa]|uniref:Uncharacterized protein n=1 Tax=Camellia lanceoleosa TaxID=1840588 RepID=A0ACC0GF32_9ERIC|nr:hypothetical protein LOK49_LG09G01096 [Camellia lanceoleosa]